MILILWVDLHFMQCLRKPWMGKSKSVIENSCLLQTNTTITKTTPTTHLIKNKMQKSCLCRNCNKLLFLICWAFTTTAELLDEGHKRQWLQKPKTRVVVVYYEAAADGGLASIRWGVFVLAVLSTTTISLTTGNHHLPSTVNVTSQRIIACQFIASA